MAAAIDLESPIDLRARAAVPFGRRRSRALPSL